MEGNLSATFFSWIKKMGQPTSNKLETPKSVYTLPILQYGGLALFSKHSKEGRLYVQNGLERCIFFSSVKSCIQNICAVPLVREGLQVSSLLLWTRPGTKNFYKITQNSSFSVALPEHTSYNLLGRHVVDRPYNRRNVNGQRHSNLPSPTTTAYTEFKEISVDAYTENRVLRGDGRFFNHDPVSTREESLKSLEAVPGTPSENTGVNFRTNKTNTYNYSISTSITNKFQVRTTTTNTSIKNIGVIFKKSNYKEKIQGGG